VGEGEVKFWRANLGCEGKRKGKKKKKRRAYRARGRYQSNPAKISSPLFPLGNDLEIDKRSSRKKREQSRKEIATKHT